ncbi:hypothetical protein P280DRAFT_387839 [Massarina eburnea CBS 473.64]|uniref:WW domain-containing protein n=1 Tax=Massarina eburnea CBS 473.64 TaxID=1395130 RepID=A0A6A6SGR3_9PLEO|nr:hypothetical protein P280DRAFT_387839 [Massarina eburnea CBS 473.64]
MAPEQSREPALTANTADQTAQVVESAQPNKASQREDGEVAESDRDSLLAPASKVSAAERLNAMTAASDPPLPYDEAPPEDDGWTCYMDYDAGAYKFYNRYTGVYQWENPRVPEATAASSYGSYDSSAAPGTSSPPKRVHGGYNPAIHGSYDPNADYAKEAEREEEEMDAAVAAAAGLPTAKDEYATTAHFNRFNGRFQQPGLNPEYHNDENKSKRQMNAFFDVDAAANSHQGRSLKAERRSKTLSKKELKAFQSKRRDKKEEKRRAWLTKD